MIAPGVLAQQALLAGGVPTWVRPQRVANRQAAANGAALAVPLPVGWVPGQLCVMAIAASDTDAISIAGWTAAGGVVIGSGVRLYTLYRVLESGDSFTIPSGGRRVAMCVTFAPGTFSTVSPIGSSTGSSATPSVGLSGVDFEVGEHYQLHFVGTNGTGVFPITGPYADINTGSGTGTTTLTFALGSGGQFNGGFSPSSSFSVSTSVNWASVKVVIRGYY